MECKNCKYKIEIPIKPTDTNGEQFQRYTLMLRYSKCKISNTKTSVTKYNCERIKSDEDIEKMYICFNCKHWIGGGDFGLSCKKDYYIAEINGFRKSCDLFEAKNISNKLD